MHTRRNATQPQRRFVASSDLRVIRSQANPKRRDDGESEGYESEGPQAGIGEDVTTTAGKIVGHAALYNVETVLYAGDYYEVREIIRPGAFKRALNEGQDVRALFNHDPNFVLGRTTAGTLTLTEDAIGLYQVTTAPTTQTIEDLVLSPMERKDITGQSFAFQTRLSGKTITTEDKDSQTCVYDRGGDRITVSYDGNKRMEMWEIIDADLFDVSVVTYPQYEGTAASMDYNSRSQDASRALSRRIAKYDRPHRRKIRTPNLDEVSARLAAFGALPIASIPGTASSRKGI